MLIALIAAFLCVAANAFFVAAEFALATARPTSLQAAANAGDKRALHALKLVEKLDAYLTATQLGITFASLGLGWLGEPAVARFIEVPLRSFDVSPSLVHGIALSVSFGIITFLHIVVGELIPKSLAIQRPEAVSRWTAKAMEVFYYLTYPIQVMFNAITNRILRVIGLQAAGSTRSVLSAPEIKLIIQSAFSTGGPDNTKRELLERVLTSTDRHIRTVMIPRVDMVTLNMTDSFEECLAMVRRHGYSRYPLVQDGDPDQVLGYIHTKDLFIASPRVRNDLTQLRRDLLFLPETLTTADALSKMKRERIPIGIVVDEYGGTSGLVTLEDIVEEIVGDIQDETDLEAPRLYTRSDGTLVMDGSLPIQELELEGIAFPHTEEGDTMAGCITSVLERLAYPGDRVKLGNFEATVEDVRGRRIERVALRRISDHEASKPAFSTLRPQVPKPEP
ncbi:MAG: HlyC/CorC family transporter [Myxococcales bacterium]|nr:HlyC/CorC family transporter [Myxococcales bacterium]MCB9708569.1 HlyC/CorC family transporter [Myxococcales bacterium]